MVRIKEFPNRTFKTIEHAFEALMEHKERLISLKCSQVYKSCEKSDLRILPFLTKSVFSEKAQREPWMKDGMLYPIINTTKYFDSHNDVHFDGLWKRSLQHNKGKLYYVEAHSLKIADIIAWPENVKSFTKEIPWSLVGKNFSGNTEALIYEIPEDKIGHQGALKVISEKREMQNSVRMQYVEIKLGLNSESKDWEEEKAYFDEKYPLIANKEDVDEYGYFWGVEEAKIFKEGSMVIAGSNDATSIIYTEEPAQGTSSKTETAQGTSKSEYLRSLI